MEKLPVPTERIDPRRITNPSSPFGGPTNSGSSKAFTLSGAEMFPFYCDIHALIEMKGAAFVAP